MALRGLPRPHRRPLGAQLIRAFSGSDGLLRLGKGVGSDRRGWAVAIVLVNSLGIMPVAYFVVGSRSDSHERT